MPVRPSGETGGVEQHRLHARKRVGHLGRDLCCAKSPVNCLAEGCNCPSPVCCASSKEPMKNVRFNLMLPLSPTTNCRLAELKAGCFFLPLMSSCSQSGWDYCGSVVFPCSHCWCAAVFLLTVQMNLSFSFYLLSQSIVFVVCLSAYYKPPGCSWQCGHMLPFDVHASLPQSPFTKVVRHHACVVQRKFQLSQLSCVIPDAQHIQVMMIKIHLLLRLKLDKTLCAVFLKSTLSVSLKLCIKDKGICVDVFGVWYEIVRETNAIKMTF